MYSRGVRDVPRETRPRKNARRPPRADNYDALESETAPQFMESETTPQFMESETVPQFMEVDEALEEPVTPTSRKRVRQLACSPAMNLTYILSGHLL